MSLDLPRPQLVDVVPEIGALVDCKYRLIVSSQVHARAGASRVLAERWRAHCTQLLLARYPALRVAFLESAESTAVFAVRALTDTCMPKHMGAALTVIRCTIAG